MKFLNKFIFFNCSINELFSPSIFKEHLKCCFISELFNIANNELGLHIIEEEAFELSSSYTSFPNNTLFLGHIILLLEESINSPSIGTIIRLFFFSPAFTISVSLS